METNPNLKSRVITKMYRFTSEQAQEVKSIAAIVSNRVFQHLQPLASLKQEDNKILNITKDTEETIRYLCGSSTARGLETLDCYVLSWIMELYTQTLLQKGLDVYAVAAIVAHKAAVDLRTILGSKTAPSHKASSSLLLDLRDRLLFAFTQLDYHGVAVNEFRSYLNDCLKEYKKKPANFTAPYVTIVQSSGFGKSRLLQELARVTMKEKDGPMRVLYTCIRVDMLHYIELSGFPLSTKALGTWLFFPEGATRVRVVEQISLRLQTVFYYALQNWENVGIEWFGLFTQPGADRDVAEKLSEYSSQSIDNPHDTDKVVVIAVDEAKTLLLKNVEGLELFCLFRSALCRANDSIQKVYPSGGIYAAFVDTNPTISDLSPCMSRSSSMTSIHSRFTLCSRRLY